MHIGQGLFIPFSFKIGKSVATFNSWKNKIITTTCHKLNTDQIKIFQHIKLTNNCSKKQMMSKRKRNIKMI